MLTARSHLESLLKARKLDVTLTSASPFSWDMARGAHDLAQIGVPSMDAGLGGGLRRGHVSEIVGARSSGRTTIVCRALAAAAARGELVALIDTCDRFDPESAAALGFDLSSLLWVRESGDAARSLKAMNLVLQAGGFGLVVWDLADVPSRIVSSLPFTTWFRLARVIEGSDTVALLLAADHLARSSGGVTIAMQEAGDEPARPRPTTIARPGTSSRTHARWQGRSDRARLLHGLEIRPRVIGRS